LKCGNILVIALASLIELISGAGQGYAEAPQLYKTCPGLSRPGRIGLVLFDTNCTSAFLLPGSEGTLTVTGAFISISNASCTSVRAMEEAALGVFGDAAKRESKRKELEHELRSLQVTEQASNDEIAQYRELAESVSQELESIVAAIPVHEEKFRNTCNNDKNISFECSNIAGALEKAKTAKIDLESKKSKLEGLIKTTDNEIKINGTRVQHLITTINALTLGSQSSELQQRAKDELANFRRELGATISVTLKTALVEDLRRLRQLNSSPKINIDQARFTGGSVFVAGIDRSGVPEAVGGVSVKLPGVTIEGGGVLFTNASGVQLSLDAIAACQAFEYKRPDPANLALIEQRLAANVVAKAYVKYRALVGASVKVEMNYKRFYELMVENKSSNGFFRPSTLKQISEKMSGENTLSVTISDEGGVLSSELKDSLQNAMRARVIQRALDLLNVSYTGIDKSASSEQAKAGAPVLSAELRKCVNPWCQAGAAVVDVAHAIFGGSESVQRFVQSSSVQSIELYNQHESYEFATDLVFVPGH
jgi:hypothetical protein